MIHKLISRFWIRLDKGRQFNWCKDSKGLLWVQAEACSINEQMQKQVNQSILVFFRCIVNVHCLVNIKALKEKTVISWPTRLLQVPLSDLASLGIVTTTQAV